MGIYEVETKSTDIFLFNIAIKYKLGYNSRKIFL